MRTYVAKKENIQRKTYLINAKGKVLGRLATKVATVLRGKHKPTYTPHLDTGDRVIVVNADKITVTGKKREQKIYSRYTGYPGGLKEINLQTLMEKKPAEAVRLAIKGMIPHNKLGAKVLKKLRVYAGDKHPHTAQKPEILEI